MPYWYEVFDNEHVQLTTRKQAAMLTISVVSVVAISVVCFVAMYAGHIPVPAGALLLSVTWMFTFKWSFDRLQRLRRVMWCIKISDRRIVGYDYARRQTILDWTKISRVELVGTGLILTEKDDHSLEIPHLFPEFAELSHRVVHYAEFYNIPVFLDGQPWQNIDVYDIFPFLLDGASSDTHGSKNA